MAGINKPSVPTFQCLYLFLSLLNLEYSTLSRWNVLIPDSPSASGYNSC